MRVDLSAFQRNAESAILHTLGQVGRTVQQHELFVGTIPFYSTSPQAVVHIEAGDLKIWLFSDEANLMVGHVESRFELPDFESTEDLLRSLLQTVENAVSAK